MLLWAVRRAWDAAAKECNKMRSSSSLVPSLRNLPSVIRMADGEDLVGEDLVDCALEIWNERDEDWRAGRVVSSQPPAPRPQSLAKGLTNFSMLALDGGNACPRALGGHSWSTI